jgi:hypothetical protein
MLPRSMAAILSWAVSPRLRNFFCKEFEFHFPAGLNVIGTQMSVPELKERLLSLADVDKENKAFQDKLVETENLRQIPPMWLHGECVLLTRAYQKRFSGRSFCSYIGTSKLSCIGCNAFFNAWNSIRSTTWATSGCHQKFYPWGVLQSRKDISGLNMQLLEEIKGTLLSEFQRRCEDKFLKFGSGAQPHSDSSGSSGTMVADERDMDGLAQAKARAKERRARRQKV